jgi:hypothetical protein
MASNRNLKIGSRIGTPMTVLVMVIYGLSPFVGLVLILGSIGQTYGWLGCVVAVFVLPLTLVLGPLYELWHLRWLSAVLVYGVPFVVAILVEILASSYERLALRPVPEPNGPQSELIDPPYELPPHILTDLRSQNMRPGPLEVTADDVISDEWQTFRP